MLLDCSLLGAIGQSVVGRIENVKGYGRIAVGAMRKSVVGGIIVISRLLHKLRKNDSGYLLILCLAGALVFLAFWIGEKERQIVSQIGFACAIISGILILVAVFYAIFHRPPRGKASGR